MISRETRKPMPGNMCSISCPGATAASFAAACSQNFGESDERRGLLGHWLPSQHLTHTQISYTIFCSPILICCHRFNYPEMKRMKRNEQMNPCEPSANLMARMDALPSNEQREAGLTHSSDLSPHSSRVISSPVVFLQTVNLGRNAMVWPSIPHLPLVSASLHIPHALVY